MIISEVEITIKKFGMLKDNDRVIVGISGGPDSVALIYILNKLKKKWSLYLHLAHLNHMIRKKEAEEDCEFVRDLAKKLGYGLTCKRINVQAFAQTKKLSLEDAARKVRYEFLLTVANEHRATKIALGHNRDDQAETVLMRFLRGSGISGLRGMPAKRKLDNYFIIRPLSELTRKQIIEFLSQENISYRIDSSNLENIYMRNRVRNQLLPSLEKGFNPNIKKVLINLAENMATDFDYLEKSGFKKFRSLRKYPGKDKIAFSTKKFLALHKALQKLVARLAIAELKGNVRKIDYRHWKELEDLVENRPQDSIVDLPGGISVAKQASNLIFYKKYTS